MSMFVWKLSGEMGHKQSVANDQVPTFGGNAFFIIFFLLYQELNSGPHTCQVGAVTELYLQPFRMLQRKKIISIIVVL